MNIWVLWAILILSYLFLQFYFKETFEDLPKEMILTSQTLNLQPSLKKYTLVSLPNKAWDYVLFKLVNRQRLDLFKTQADAAACAQDSQCAKADFARNYYVLLEQDKLTY